MFVNNLIFLIPFLKWKVDYNLLIVSIYFELFIKKFYL